MNTCGLVVHGSFLTFVFPRCFQEIELLLNDRPPPEKLPQEFEDVTLEDYVSTERGESSGERREAYDDEDDDDGGRHQPQCASQ